MIAVLMEFVERAGYLFLFGHVSLCLIKLAGCMPACSRELAGLEGLEGVAHLETVYIA